MAEWVNEQTQEFCASISSLVSRLGKSALKQLLLQTTHEHNAPEAVALRLLMKDFQTFCMQWATTGMASI
eukprot:3167591-Prorocentrum_lima.AAC.1